MKTRFRNACRPPLRGGAPSDCLNLSPTHRVGLQRILVYGTTRAAFSLVEVTLALAIMAIGLIAIIGMIPQGIQSSRNAADNTLVATIVHDTFNQMRQQALTGTGWPPAPQDVYYDAFATNIVTTLQDKYFHLVVAPLLSPSIPNLYIVTATITWPDKSATSRPPNTNVFATQIANYQQ